MICCKLNIRVRIALLCCFALLLTVQWAFAWQIKEAPLMTQWSKPFDTSKVWPEYPRMQMKRSAWMNLNGIWQFQQASSGTSPYTSGNLSGDIMVPFPWESAISGIMRNEQAFQYAWYKKKFTLPAEWVDGTQRILLHFGAVDYQAEVFINGTEVFEHMGGYDAFTVDITDNLANGGQGEQEVAVRVYDPTNARNNWNPMGKQRYNPGGIFYIGCSGIWQTVWLEPVPAEASIRAIKITPDVDNQSVKVSVQVVGTTTDMKLYVIPKNKGRGMYAMDSTTNMNSTFDISLSALNLWWPDRPFLYDLGIYLKKGKAFVDSVQCYFGMRKVASVTEGGYKRIKLNGARMYNFGPLDQGYWPDGIYTAPCYEALRFDVVQTKAAGFNCTRKHVKVEPDIWYWLCDSIGLMVWQDMASIPQSPGTDGRVNYERELDSLVSKFYNHPSIIMWVVFNEAWGQFDTERLTQRVMSRDPSRLVSCTSGWTFAPVGHCKDYHSYPNPWNNTLFDEPNPSYLHINGEYGGMMYTLDGHEWNPAQSFGYMTVTSQNAYNNQFITWIDNHIDYKNQHAMQGAIYTQITDVETECNGLLTYDRLIKPDMAGLYDAAQDLLDDYTIDPVVPPSDSIPDSFYDQTSISGSGQMAYNPLAIAKVYTKGNAIVVRLSGRPVSGNANLQIVNTLGRQLYRAVLSGKETEIKITAHALANGVYFIRLKNGKAQQYHRFIIR